MSMTSPFKRFFRNDDRAYESFLRREAKYRRCTRPGPFRDDGPDADRLRHEVFRAGF